MVWWKETRNENERKAVDFCSCWSSFIFIAINDDGVGSIKNDERSIHVSWLVLLMVLWFVLSSSTIAAPSFRKECIQSHRLVVDWRLLGTLHSTLRPVEMEKKNEMLEYYLSLNGLLLSGKEQEMQLAVLEKYTDPLWKII